MEISSVQGVIRHESRRILGRRFLAMFKEGFFENFLNRIWEFHPGIGEELHAVVVKGIVRGRNNHAGLEPSLEHKARDSGRSNNSGEVYRHSHVAKSRSQKRRDAWTGLASIHPNQHASCRTVLLEIGPQRPPA